MSISFIDLFAGIGGFHAAGDAFGWNCVFANEIDPAAARIYEQNWGLNPLGNIHEVIKRNPFPNTMFFLLVFLANHFQKAENNLEWMKIEEHFFTISLL